MEKIRFTTTINAPKEKVWKVLWDDSTYRKWTSAFTEGSHAISDWNEGSKVLFLDPQKNGMVSMIAESRANEFMSFKHLGVVKEGVEDTESEEVKQWAGSHENYTLTGNNGTTELLVEMDITEEFKAMFEGIWPKAMENIKRLAEKKQHIQKVTPFLWFDGKAEEAANLYVSVFDDAKITDAKPGPNGTKMSVGFTIGDQEFIAFNGGPMFTFTPAISLFVKCEDQQEVDELWEKLSEGGRKDRCGWLQDKFGVSWQIVPTVLEELLFNKDQAKAKRVMDAMLQMNKLDIETLKQAADSSNKV
jgi:predicted 3-demethylubiquinone-9 3-methyltransferase (glyoxalase superfamily)